ncbi:MAG: TrmH family RNA methyltransferase [Acidimicrobiales bacterium]
MSEPIVVDDPRDPRLADYVGLRDAELRRHVEGEFGLFIAEGVLTIRALLRSRYQIRSLLVTPAKWAALASDVERAGVAAPVYVADRSLLAAVAGFNLHRGAVAAADRLPLPEPTELLGGVDVVAVVEGVNDLENLGAVFRNAAAFDVGAVLLDPTSADPLYRRVVRVSLGHVLHVPFTRLAPWPDGLALVRSAGFELLALTPRREARPIDEVAGDRPGRVALLLGAEGPGLSDEALGRADRLVRVRMAEGVDSLNVATAAAIAFYELRRSR